jgi:hypothetical protein
MVRKIFEKLAIPGLVLAVAAGATLASSAAVEPPAAYGPQAQRLEAGAAAAHASAVFERADINSDGQIDADEYSALSIVIAELARLNGFVAVDFADGGKTVALPIAAPQALAGSERIRVAAVAAREFHLVAGADDMINRNEFVDAQMELFSAADANRNGVLSERELRSYAAWQARIAPRNA